MFETEPAKGYLVHTDDGLGADMGAILISVHQAFHRLPWLRCSRLFTPLGAGCMLGIMYIFHIVLTISGILWSPPWPYRSNQLCFESVVLSCAHSVGIRHYAFELWSCRTGMRAVLAMGMLARRNQPAFPHSIGTYLLYGRDRPVRWIRNPRK